MITLCEDCFPHWDVHEILTIVPLSPCAKCGRYDMRRDGGLRAHLFRGNPTAPPSPQAPAQAPDVSRPARH